MGPYAILGTVHQRPLGWTFENSIRSIHWSETGNAKLAARSQRLYHIFSDQDIEGGPQVVIVNETTARIHFADNAIGNRVSVDGPQGPWREIIGVVRASKYGARTSPWLTDLNHRKSGDRSGLSVVPSWRVIDASPASPMPARRHRDL